MLEGSFFEKGLSFLKENLYDNFRRNIGKPAYLAASCCAGVFFTFIPIPLQTTLCILAWAALRKRINFNVGIAGALTLISNPATDVPFFYAYYAFGEKIVGGGARSFENFAEIFGRVGGERGGFWRDAIGGAGVVWGDIGIPVLAGSAVLCATLSVAAYALVYAAVKCLAGYRRARLRELS